MADQARQARQQTREKAEGLFQKMKRHQVLTFLGTIAALVLLGLAITGTVIGLILLTPVFLFFSPILVPLGIILFLCAAGALTATGAFVAFVAVLAWLYNYLKGGHPPGAEQAEQLRMRTMETAEQLKHKAREAGTKTKDAAPGA